MKKLCRTYGIQRWPYRHILSLRTKAGKLARLDAGEAVSAVEKLILGIKTGTRTDGPCDSRHYQSGTIFCPGLSHTQQQFGGASHDQQDPMHRQDRLHHQQTSGHGASADLSHAMLSIADIEWQSNHEGSECCLPSIAHIQGGVAVRQMMNEQAQTSGQKQSREPDGDAKDMAQDKMGFPGLWSKRHKGGQEELMEGCTDSDYLDDLTQSGSASSGLSSDGQSCYRNLGCSQRDPHAQIVNERTVVVQASSSLAIALQKYHHHDAGDP